MHGRKYFWENDYVTSAPTNYIEMKDVTLKPTEASLSSLRFSPTLIKPIVECVRKMSQDKKKIVVVGDYDMDGMSGTTILVKALNLLGADVDYYIPNRFTDGYGINADIVERLQAQGTDCLITVDNGIVAFDAAERAQQLDVTLIITDHHARGDALPAATHILHPALDEHLSTVEICGAAVAYLLAKELLILQGDSAEVDDEFLQLATLGTIADMMPLNEPWNRTLSYLGFQRMQTTPLFLLAAFLQRHHQRIITSDDLSFKFIPTINAVGRLADGNVVVEAFLSRNQDDIAEYIHKFDAYNEERKTLTETIYDAILTKLPEREWEEQGFLLFIGQDFHQGVLGLIAQRLMQRLSRPVIVLTNSTEKSQVYTGSARAFGAYNVGDYLQTIKEIITKGGGHNYAGGLSVQAEAIPALRKATYAYNASIADKLTEDQQSLPLRIDAWLPLSGLTEKFVQRQELFAPYGEKNKKFVIGIKQVLVRDIQPLGKTQQHVKLKVMEAKKTYQIVAFQMFDLLGELAKYAVVDLVVEAQRHTFNGASFIQYLLLDIRLPEKQIFDLRQQKALPEHTLRTESEAVFIVDEVPLDRAAFLMKLNEQKIKHIYLPVISFEHDMVYAEEIDQKYFNFVYKYTRQKKVIDLADKSLYAELSRRKVPKSIFLYILRVFSDLNFVIMEDNICSINIHAKKADLVASQSYREMKDWLNLRRILLTGTIETLYETLTTQ